MTAGSDAVQDLLPLVFAAPNEALTQAEAVLRRRPTPLHASVAHQVIGIWQRDFGDTRLALRHLRRARDWAARAGSADREADVLATLGVALVHSGRTRQGLDALGRGVRRGTGHTRARVLFRRAYAWWVLGHHKEALEDVRRAVPVLRHAGDVIWTARALTLRATVHLALGAVERAEADFASAEDLWAVTDQEHDKADAVESRGLAAFRSGDVPAALRLLDEAEERYAKLGTPTFMLSIRRCEVLMAAGLAAEALAEADTAIAELDSIGGQSTRKAELLLAAARAARHLHRLPRRLLHPRHPVRHRRMAVRQHRHRVHAPARRHTPPDWSGGPRRLLVWSERWRATALSAPPTRPPADPELLSHMTAYREIAARAEEARMEGRPVPALEREQRRLERAIRSRTLHMRGEAHGDDARFDAGRLLERLGDGVRLVELVVVDGRVQVLLCGQGRVRRFEAGLLAAAEAEAEHVQAGLRRLAHPGAQARLPVVEAAGRRLEELLLGPAAAHLGEGPVVIVPPGRLHRVPWALLPSLRERVVSVSPSASSWLRARETRPPRGGRKVLVRGPGLATGGAEVTRLAARYSGATVLEHGEASVPRVLAELDGSGLAHIAAHGTFRTDGPMFSSLRMADGPLIVHDFERLGRSPYRIILSCCDTARFATVGADELLGLVTALLPLGTAGVVACSAPVNDAAVVPLMLALHEGLAAGLPLPEALRDARAALPPDPLHRATGWAFTAFGAA
ncbi:CHAT domain-containing protein [Streptomyces sp. S-9]|uniref:CHAT domain-containing protein n=1 Tax=Streptomyces sp. S-9 TaxID=2806600 RepID=UPI00193C6965|nr:CHAT domain-containing protein [Streptomyces sp. S-9]